MFISFVVSLICRSKQSLEEWRDKTKEMQREKQQQFSINVPQVSNSRVLSNVLPGGSDGSQTGTENDSQPLDMLKVRSYIHFVHYWLVRGNKCLCS